MSIRENIIRNVVETLQQISDLKAVERTLPASADVRNVPTGNFPFAYIIGGLPVVEYPEWYNQTDVDDEKDELESELEINVFIFGRNDNHADMEISALSEAAWIALNKDRSRGGHAQRTEVEILPSVARQRPNFAFQLIVKTTYRHSYTRI